MAITRERILELMRAELERQEADAEGWAPMIEEHPTEGYFILDGDFDLGKVADVILAAIRQQEKS